MDKALVKLMRPYTTKLVKKGNKKRIHGIMRYLRPDPDNDNFIIVQVDKGIFGEILKEERVSVWDVEPCIKIRFIRPNYDVLFEVTDFGFVEFDTYDFVDGRFVKSGTEKRRVIADDCETDALSACHFHFEGKDCFHICEFAERVNPNGDRVRPYEEKKHEVKKAV